MECHSRSPLLRFVGRFVYQLLLPVNPWNITHKEMGKWGGGEFCSPPNIIISWCCSRTSIITLATLRKIDRGIGVRFQARAASRPTGCVASRCVNAAYKHWHDGTDDCPGWCWGVIARVWDKWTNQDVYFAEPHTNYKTRLFSVHTQLKLLVHINSPWFLFENSPLNHVIGSLRLCTDKS